LLLRALCKYILLSGLLLLLIGSLMSCAAARQYQPMVNDPLVMPVDGNAHISLLSYNVHAIFGKDQHKLDALMDYVNREAYDFVVFQELFDEQTRMYIYNKINNGVYKTVVSRVDYDSFPEFLFQDAGLFLMSRFPQVDLSSVMLDDQVTVTEGAVHMILTKELSITTDFLSNKSVLGSLHKINDEAYIFLFTTHVQAISSRRQKRRQFVQIKNFIDYAVSTVLNSGLIKSPGELSVLLAGDFNSDAYDRKDIQILSEELGYPRDLHKEQHPRSEDYTITFKAFNFFKRFDYIWAYDQIGSFPLKKIRIESINATDLRDRDNDSISDHMALKATLSFENALTDQLSEENMTGGRGK
jgi:endonuclease/exonuclease/phosphatase family metal-dependent hydrolase